AMAGVDVVVSAVTGFPSTSPVRVDGEAAAVLAEAAQRAGARLVLVSVAGASKDSHMELFRAKYAAEQELVQFDLDWTIIRSDAFADLWIELLTQSAGRTHRPVVFGPGNNPMGWVAVRDVSAATVSVAETTSLRRRTLTISGPQRLTLTELASHVMAAHDWPGNPRHVPTPILRFASMLPGAPGRQTSAALAMNTLPPVVDDAREAVPHLPSTPVQALLELARAEHP
ncbi:MAG: NAD(P)H-binding protein, partial [Ornithinibacter sp.]